MAPSKHDRPERPAATYEEACARFEALLREDTQAVDPESRSRLISPGQRTQRAIVFLHGLTNSPQQFLRLSERFVARGYTVFIPARAVSRLSRPHVDRPRPIARRATWSIRLRWRSISRPGWPTK